MPLGCRDLKATAARDFEAGQLAPCLRELIVSAGP